MRFIAPRSLSCSPSCALGPARSILWCTRTYWLLRLKPRENAWGHADMRCRALEPSLSLSTTSALPALFFLPRAPYYRNLSQEINRGTGLTKNRQQRLLHRFWIFLFVFLARLLLEKTPALALSIHNCVCQACRSLSFRFSLLSHRHSSISLFFSSLVIDS